MIFDVADTYDNLQLGYDTVRPPRLIVLVGVPGVGKSSLAQALINSNPMSVWLSSDKIREQLYGDANCQDNPGKIFEIMQHDSIEALNRGFDVIYDATNITRKSRAGILNLVPKHVRKECFVVWAPIDICVERDKARERTVGKEVIDKMLKRFEAPFYDEGFDEITVHISDIHYNEKKYYQDLIRAMNISHDNPHHTLSVLEHCKACGNALVGSAPAFVIEAGFLHDIGKPYTKTFVNTKGETTDTAHYYGHQGVGAWLSYGLTGNSPTLAWLISTHMAPFINLKYYNSLPACYKSWIDALHAADKLAH